MVAKRSYVYPWSSGRGGLCSGLISRMPTRMSILTTRRRQTCLMTAHGLSRVTGSGGVLSMCLQMETGPQVLEDERSEGRGLQAWPLG